MAQTVALPAASSLEGPRESAGLGDQQAVPSPPGLHCLPAQLCLRPLLLGREAEVLRLPPEAPTPPTLQLEAGGKQERPNQKPLLSAMQMPQGSHSPLRCIRKRRSAVAPPAGSDTDSEHLSPVTKFPDVRCPDTAGMTELPTQQARQSYSIQIQQKAT